MKADARGSTFPKIVYKYRSWSNKNHRRILTNNEVWMASPGIFNDPFDCRIEMDFDNLSDVELLQWGNAIVNSTKEEAIAENIDVEAKRQEWAVRVRDKPALKRECENLVQEALFKKLGILSLSSVWDNTLMWSHYGDSHKGFCIGFNEHVLRESKCFDGGNNVSYQKQFPVLNPLRMKPEDFRIRWSIKAQQWNYEEEYRLFKMDFSPDSNEDSAWRSRIVPEDSIAEVVIGTEMSSTHRNELVSICHQRKIPVYQAKKNLVELRITRDLLP
ncbi:MAG: DUF2971 domain-containing protein [Bacteroidia bacterium]